MLNAFFASVFTTESVDELPECKNIFYGNEEHKLSNYHISSSMVKDKLLKLKLILPVSYQFGPPQGSGSARGVMQTCSVL